MDHHHKEQRWRQQNQRGNRRDLIVTRHAGVIEQQRQRSDIRRPDEVGAGKLIQRLQKNKDAGGNDPPGWIMSALITPPAPNWPLTSCCAAAGSILSLPPGHHPPARRRPGISPLRRGPLMLAHVAAGQLHAYYEAHMNSWDALAGMLSIEEAGGTCNAFLANEGLRRGNRVLAGCAGVQLRLAALLEK